MPLALFMDSFSFFKFSNRRVHSLCKMPKKFFYKTVLKGINCFFLGFVTLWRISSGVMDKIMFNKTFIFNP